MGTRSLDSEPVWAIILALRGKRRHGGRQIKGFTKVKGGVDYTDKHF